MSGFAPPERARRQRRHQVAQAVVALAEQYVVVERRQRRCIALPTTGGLFVGLVVGVILIIGGLTFFPALALGPIVEHPATTVNILS